MSIQTPGLAETEAASTNVMMDVGDHDVIIEEAEEGQSSGGYPEIRMRFVERGGGATIRDWRVVTANSYAFVKQLLDAVGLPAGDELNVDDLTGKELTIYVGMEDDNQTPPQKRRRVQAYKPLAASDNGASDDSDIPF